MSKLQREEIFRRLRPIRPPRIVDDVLGKDQLESVLDLIRRKGPWDLILKHHFRSLEELVATTSGGRPPDPNASLDAFLTPTFRDFLANDGVCLHPEAEPIFYDRRLLAWAREFWATRYSTDPLRDSRFIELLARIYDVAPSSYPLEAPVATHAA